MDDLWNRLLGNIHRQIRLRWCLVDIVNASKAPNLPTSGLGIVPLSVRLLTVLQGCSDMYKEEVPARSAGMGDGVLGRFARMFVRGDGSGDDGCTSTGQFRCYECYPLNVGVSVFG